MMESLKTQFVFRAHAVDPDQPLAELFARVPGALPLMIRLGFTPLANPILRETVAPRVSVREAAETLPINLDRLLVDLERIGASDKSDPVALATKG